MAIAPGLRAELEHEVTPADTAAALGSGDAGVEVLGTPRVLALLEAATVRALAGALAPGATTVGARVELDHLLPSPVGARVRAEAVLERVEGRRLHFAVRLRDGERLAAAGHVTRVVVNRQAFLERAARRP